MKWPMGIAPVTQYFHLQMYRRVADQVGNLHFLRFPRSDAGQSTVHQYAHGHATIIWNLHEQAVTGAQFRVQRFSVGN